MQHLRWFHALLCGLVLVAALPAANPPPTQVFYIPFPEDDQLAGFNAITTVAVDPQAVFVTFSAATDNTVIYYDHWEDGYEKEITNPAQSTTLVFGDGNASNGYPPGNASDLIPAGTVFSLRNFVNSTTLSSVLDFDARDKVASYKPISLTKTTFPASTNTLLGGCVEVFERGLWGTEYRVPVGVNMPTTTATASLTWDADIFSYTAISIMAGPGGATVEIDADNDGNPEQNVTLAEGETHYVNDVNAGGRVSSDRPVQVILFTGRIGSTYQSRDTSLLPTYRWGSSYYAPVSTPSGYVTSVFLYNPGTTAITVNYDYRSSATSYVSNSVSVPAGGNARVALTASNGTNNFGAYRFYTTGTTPPVFSAFCAVDSGSTTTTENQAYDGGFTLVGQSSLTTQVLVSLGIGRDPYSATSPTQNGNPIWLTTAGNGHTPATVYVDYNGDNAGPLTDANGNRYDVALSLRELEQAKIFDPDGDQSGLLAYTLDPSVRIAAAWAQDPSIASPAQPGLDVSTLLPPLREGEGGKKSNLFIDADGDGSISGGDTLEIDIRGVNSARAAIPGPFRVQDSLPSDFVYVPGSTRYRFSVGGNWQAWVAIADDGSGTAFPLDGSGFSVPGTMGKGQQLQVTFQAQVKNYGELSSANVTNTGTVEISPYGLVLAIEWTDIIYGSIGDRLWTDTDGDGVQDPGENGIPNIDVFADLNSNGVWDGNEPKSTTDANGNYLLTGLEAGTYQVRVDFADIIAVNVGYGTTYDLDGHVTQNVATVTLDGAQDRVDADFGYRIGASIGDRVWMDRDADGVQENGEPGINGVRVYLDLNSNSVFEVGEPNTITFGDGNYYFGNLNAGSYTVRVDASTLPVGNSQTYDHNGALDHSATVTLVSAEHRGDLDFGYRGSLSIGDFVWEDANADGFYSLVGSITYAIYNGRVDINNDGASNGSDDGFIGSMRVINGYLDIDNDNGATVDADDDGFFMGYPVINGGLDLNGSGTISTSDDGSAVYEIYEAAIANVRVYIDVDNDGIFDANEPSAITSSTGAYTIGGLYQGSFVVRVDPTTLPASYIGTYDLTSPVTDHRAIVVLSGANRTDVDFGYRNDANLGDLIWNDRDADGIRDAGEPGIEGVLVYIDADGDNVFDQGLEAYDITDINGIYLIDNLSAATYSVRVEFSTLPQGSTQTFDLDATLDHEATRTLATSENATNVDFGYRAAASFGDFVWNDGDADGIQDVGEAGIAGVRVYLDMNGDSVFDSATEPSAITNTSGAYSIANLLPGTYTARIDVSTLPSAFVQTFDLEGALDHAATFSLSAAQTRSDIDFGYSQRVSLGDFVWNDVNANGQQDGGETGISGVTVTVFNAANDTIAGTTTTDSNGAYAFTLMPGTYYLVFETPSGYIRTVTDLGADASDSDGSASAGRSANVTLASGQSNVTVDMGFHLPAAIGDFVWNDINANGIQDVGESGLNGVSVNLFRPGFGPDGIGGNSDDSTAVATTTTSGGGAYSFAGLRPGAYQVNFGSLLGYSRTLADRGADGSDSDADAGTGVTATFAVAAGATNNTIDAGYYQPSTIGDFVWNDLNANGIQDLGENGLNGVPVTLFRPGFGPDGIAGNSDDSAAVASTATAGGGAYSFTGLRPGTYQVSFGVLGGYSRTLADQGAEGSDSDADAGTGLTASFPVAAGATNNSIDAGYFQPSAIGDFVWNDINANGIQDLGESGLNGVSVSLFRPGFGPDGIAGNSDDSTAVATTTTAGGGAYSFSGLRPGTYQVNFGNLAGYSRTLGNQGAGGLDSDADAGTGSTAAFALAAGVTNQTIDAGYFQPSAIGDYVWNDSNANGVQDPGENGLDGVSVSLFRPGFGPDGIAGNADDTAAVATTITAGGGTYAFTGLRPGSYQVTFGPLVGYLRTLADQGADGSDSDADFTTGETATFAVAAGATNNSMDAGYFQPSAIGDFVWNDSNANGIQDGGESGLDGVSVSLFRPGYGPDGIAGNSDDAIAVSTTTTAGGGAYSFTGLRPGNYQVTFGALAGYSRTLSDQGTDGSDSDADASTGSTAVFALAEGVNNNTVDAGYFQAATIGDFVWNDSNANGIQDGGEGGLDGVLVSLFRPGFGPDGIAGNSDDALAVSTTTTAGGGAYSFTGLRPGTYQVSFGALAGYSSTLADQGADGSDSDADASTGLTATFTVAEGETNDSLDAGYFEPATIGDFVWNDINADGIQDSGESGLDGVSISLFRPGFGPDGIEGNSDDSTAVATTLTAGGGAYSFTGLRPGTYQVSFGNLAGYTRTLADQGVDGADSDADPGTGLTVSFAMAAGATNNSIDAGYYQPSTIGDFVWNDSNANGIQDGGESGLDGVSVSLFRPGFGLDGIAGNADDADPVATLLTSGGGAYSFGGLAPGSYVVQFGSVAGFSRTLVNQGSDAADSDASLADGTTVSFVLPPGVVDSSVDAGFYQPGTVSGHLYLDVNGDGNQDPGEPDLADVSVVITDGNGAQQTVVSDHLGNWSAVVPPGPVIANVDEDDPDFPVGAIPTEGDDPTSVSAISGSTVDGGIDGYFVPGSIVGTVQADLDGDSDGDLPLGGVTLTLRDSGGNVVATTTTESDGSYEFTGLPPGSYTVEETDLTGYASVTPNSLPVVVPAGGQGIADFIDEAYADVAVTKGVNNGTPLVGSSVVFTLEASNPGDVDATDVVVTDLLPDGYLYVSASPAGVYDAVTGIWSIGALDVGETVSLQLTVRVQASGNYENTAVIACHEPESELGNNTDSASTTPIPLGSIAGAVWADTDNDNIGDTAISGVVLSLLDASGNPVLDDQGDPVTTVTAGDGSYRFGDLAPGTYRVSQTQPAGHVSLYDVDGANPDLIQAIVVFAGQTSAANDFVEMNSCPDTWSDWKQLHPTELAGGNPDSDRYDNFTEFAFAMAHDSGVAGPWLDGTAWIVRPSVSLPGALEGVFVRPKGAPENVTYRLQYAAAPGEPTLWQEVLITAANSLAVDNGDCTETITLPDLETLTGLTGGSGVVRIEAVLDDNSGAGGIPDGDEDHISHTEPEGWTETSFGLCCQTYNIPYLQESLFTGTVSSVNAQNLSFATEGDLASLIIPGVSYFIEVESGDNEGHRFDVVAAAGQEIQLAVDGDIHAAMAPFNTIAGPLPGSLAGDRVALRRHRSLGGIFPPSEFGAGGSQSTADQVQVYVAGAWRIYWLFDEGDADPGTSRWVLMGDAGMTDQGSIVLPPGQGMFFNNRTAPVPLLSYGEVRTYDFVRPLQAGVNLVGGGYPLVQSPTAARGRDMSIASGFFGSRDFKTADSIYVWNQDHGGVDGYTTYFLLHSTAPQPLLQRWARVGDASLLSRDGENLFEGSRATMIRSRNGIDIHVHPLPWTP
ncbi:MAG: carboxypeptidase regulatory-like domain-containing protein [Akkermansiaceae bacterium]|nr:carboxypeptidase regulatory-like domain-containing protein [Akkermansiaceae bacterium]